MNTIASPVISRRQKAAGPDHHLWNNHGTWWFHGTFHLPDGTAERVRVNLKTDDLSSARSRRDSILSGRNLQNSQPVTDIRKRSLLMINPACCVTTSYPTKES